VSKGAFRRAARRDQEPLNREAQLPDIVWPIGPVLVSSSMRMGTFGVALADRNRTESPRAFENNCHPPQLRIRPMLPDPNDINGCQGIALRDRKRLRTVTRKMLIRGWSKGFDV